MNNSNTLSSERIAEIMAFQRTDFDECPVQTEAELKEFRPKHPENFHADAETFTVPLRNDIAAYLRAVHKTPPSVRGLARQVMPPV